MLKDGVYDLNYRAAGGGADSASSGLAILREGRLVGSDPWGGYFEGWCAFDADAGLDMVRLQFRVPPEGELITGFSAGPEGAVLDIVAAVGHHPDRPAMVVEVAGAPIRVELSYVGPLSSLGAARRTGFP